MSQPAAKRQRAADGTAIPVAPQSAAIAFPVPALSEEAEKRAWFETIASLPRAQADYLVLETIARNPAIAKTVQAAYVWIWVEVLTPVPAKQARALVLAATALHPALARSVETAYEEMLKYRFDGYVSDVCYIINEKHADERDSKLSESGAGHDAAKEILGIIQSIQHSVQDENSFDAKRHALVALTEVGEAIVWGKPGIISKEVRSHFSYDSGLEDAMYDVLNAMSHAEVLKLRGFGGEEDDLTYNADDLTYEERLRQLIEEAREHSTLESLPDVLELLLQDESLNATPGAEDIDSEDDFEGLEDEDFDGVENGEDNDEDEDGQSNPGQGVSVVVVENVSGPKAVGVEGQK